jgi:hypothetical protein
MRPFLIDTTTETLMIAPFSRGSPARQQLGGLRIRRRFDVNRDAVGGRSESIDPVEGPGWIDGSI